VAMGLRDRKAVMNITIEYRRGYWTTVVNGVALMTHACLEDAIAFAPEAIIVR
jgi:hypothetical protein